jgi:hypothetical protein
MPLIPLTLRMEWSFVFAFVHPPDSTAAAAVNAVGFVAAVVVASTFLRFGFPYWKVTFRVGREEFRGVFVLSLAAAFLIMLTTAEFFGSLGGFFRNSMTEASEFLALLTSLISSIAFSAMLWLRGSSAGQSLLIAMAKTIGSPVAAGVAYLTAHSGNVRFAAVIIGLTL